MSAFHPIIVLFSVICVLWSQGMFMGQRIFGQWRKTPHYAPLWIIITLPAYLTALWPVMEWLR